MEGSKHPSLASIHQRWTMGTEAHGFKIQGEGRGKKTFGWGDSEVSIFNFLLHFCVKKISQGVNGLHPISPPYPPVFIYENANGPLKTPWQGRSPTQGICN